MSDLQAVGDRVEIEALRGECTDPWTLRDYGRLASPSTPDAVGSLYRRLTYRTSRATTAGVPANRA